MSLTNAGIPTHYFNGLYLIHGQQKAACSNVFLVSSLSSTNTHSVCTRREVKTLFLHINVNRYACKAMESSISCYIFPIMSVGLL